MTDVPDWTDAIQESGAEFRTALGVVVDGTGSGTAFTTFELNTLDRAVLVFSPPQPAGAAATITVQQEGGAAVITRQGTARTPRQLVVAYASRDLSTTWRVTVTIGGSAAGTYTFHIFTDQLLPIQDLAYFPEVSNLNAAQTAVHAPLTGALGYVYELPSGTWRQWRQAADQAAALFGVPGVGVGLLNPAGGITLLSNVQADGDSNAGARMIPVGGWAYDPARGLWDRAQAVRGRQVVQGQPDPLWAQVDAPGGAANVSVATAVIAAPGAGFRLRIVAASASRFYLSPAANGEANLQDATTGQALVRFVWGAAEFGLQEWRVPSPGYSLPANRGLRVQVTSGAAGETIPLLILYYIDPA